MVSFIAAVCLSYASLWDMIGGRDAVSSMAMILLHTDEHIRHLSQRNNGIQSNSLNFRAFIYHTLRAPEKLDT